MSYEYSAFVRYNDPDDPLRLKNLSETPTVTAYEGGDGDSIAGASIANITTGIYKVKVTHTALEPVLFKVIPHNDDKDDFPDEALLAEEVRFVLDDGVTLADGAITATKIASNAINDTKIATDAVAKIQSGLATSNALSTTDGKVDAVKAKTDNLPPSPAPAGEYDARLVTIQADLDNPDQYKADISALATSAEVGALNNITAAEVLAEEVIGGYSLAQVLTALAAKMHGLASGAGTTTITYEGIDGTSNVVVETVDGKGNRSNVVLNI